MSIAEFQEYGYVSAMVILVVLTYSYIYHLYKNRKDADGHDYEEYSNLALKDDITDTLVSAKRK